MNTITMSAVIVTLFLGGPAGWVPPVPHLKWVFPILWFVVKTSAFAFATSGSARRCRASATTS